MQLITLVCISALLYLQCHDVLGFNIAKGKPALQSSTGWGGVASRATDGNRNPIFANKSCSTTVGQKKSWLSIDLQHKYTVDTVTLFNRGENLADRLSKLYVSISDDRKPKFDGSTPKPSNAKICSYTKKPVGTSITINCGKKSGRYIFVTKDDFLTICEIEATGEATTKNPVTAGGTYKNKSGRDYFFGTKKSSWAEANTFCKSLWSGKGNLASINDDQENKWVYAQAGEKHVWIGGNDIKSEGQFVWSDGCEMSYSSWSTSQPDNWNKNEDCVTYSNYGNWNDLLCSTQVGFVCKRATEYNKCGAIIVID